MERIHEHKQNVQIPREGEQNEKSNRIEDLRNMRVVQGGQFSESCVTEKAGDFDKKLGQLLLEAVQRMI